MKVLFVLLLVIVLHSSALNVSAQVTYPAREETTVDGVCLSNEQSQLVREEITQDIRTVLQDQVLPTLTAWAVFVWRNLRVASCCLPRHD